MSSIHQDLHEDESLLDIPEFNDFSLKWHKDPVKPDVSLEPGIRVPDYGHHWGENFP